MCAGDGDRRGVTLEAENAMNPLLPEREALWQYLGAVTEGEIAFAAAATDLASTCRDRLVARYGNTDLASAKVVVALGGDGFMLETMHQVLGRPIPVYGMNCGTVGFLMNNYSEE